MSSIPSPDLPKKRLVRVRSKFISRKGCIYSLLLLLYCGFPDGSIHEGTTLVAFHQHLSLMLVFLRMFGSFSLIRFATSLRSAAEKPFAST